MKLASAVFFLLHFFIYTAMAYLTLVAYHSGDSWYLGYALFCLLPVKNAKTCWEGMWV